MTYTIKKSFAILFMAIFGSVLLYNCEPETDTLGEQLFLNGAVQGDETPYDVIAFNIDNHDSIRSDAGKLGAGVLGAFSEDQFGRQKASYLTQLRLSTYDPDFGKNATVDSVVLVMKPTYASDSVTTTTDESYVFAGVDGNVDAKKVVNTYPVRKFGKAKINGKTTFNIKVFEVTDFLKSVSDTVKSNQTFAYDPTALGAKEFKGDINSIAITKDSDGSSLFTTATPGIRIKLNKDFFQDKIIAKQDKPELQDASNFIRHIKGLRIAVDESDGYLFQFSPNTMELIMYYKYDKVDGSTTTRPQKTYSFDLGSSNAHIGQYEYNRTNSAWANSTIGNPSQGDKKLFLQGMGGPSIGIKIPDGEIDKLKKLYNDKKSAIISAKIRIYADPAWNNNYAKPTELTFLQKYKDGTKTKTNFTDDIFSLVGVPGYTLFKYYNLDKNSAYYEFIVTKSVKDLVEKGADNSTKYFRIDMAAFLNNSAGTGLAGFQYTSRSYDTNRLVFVGNDSSSQNKIQLLVVHSKK
ncbi:DUF4270 family protein [Chryseobacterium gwangjuense]|uniref:DUF4270 family protein n=1 Tax=Chryseobacterium gwangjuense TaxID=1069980 RepID=UPI001E615BAC|nr:DUF4270 family protein [Chryseobacterium gwangjuense]MCE3075586.1 DUF4270 domain-containing protein [Chryseobacterium gwangjuense]